LSSSEDSIPPPVLATVNANSRKSGLKSAGYRCSVKGCDNPPERVNLNREWPLCSHHYNRLKQQAAGTMQG